MAIGDEVLYVPSVEYAFDMGPSGRAWTFGRKAPNGKVTPLTEKQAGDLIDLTRARPHERGSLVPLAPKEPWPAVVTDEHEGFADLDVKHPLGGVTLHLKRIPHDPEGKAGSWFNRD